VATAILLWALCSTLFDHVFLFHVHLPARIILVVTLDDITDSMVFQNLNTNIPLISKSMLINDNNHNNDNHSNDNIHTCTQPIVSCLMMYYSKQSSTNQMDVSENSGFSRKSSIFNSGVPLL